MPAWHERDVTLILEQANLAERQGLLVIPIQGNVVSTWGGFAEELG